MASRDTVCWPDRFAESMEDILRDVDVAVEDVSKKSVRKACKTARDKAKSESWATHFLAPEYNSGFSYHVEDGSKSVTGEVGNKKYPGLVHLLEKGHETVGGGRTRAFPHMAPAFDEGKDVLIDECMKVEL